MGTQLEWLDSFLSGNYIIDKQHLLFIEDANKLYDALINDDPHSEIKKILEEIYRAVIFHFKTEENFLKEINFPEIDFHIQEHENLKIKLENFLKEFDTSSKIIKLSIAIDVKLTLFNHFEKFDEHYRKFIKSKLKI